VNVTVTMPYYKVGPNIRRAVLSIVNQTYPHWRLVIVNDADPDPPWQWIDDIADERIVRFDMPENRGRYFIDAVIYEACQPESWAMQDPDDFAEPDRFERMVPLAEKYGAGFAPSWWHKNGGRVFSANMLDEKPSHAKLAHHVGYGSGVISGERLRQVGGFHPGYRIGYDTYLMNVTKTIGPWGTYPKPLQNKVKRPGSLTTSPETKWGSPQRKRARADLNLMFRHAVKLHRAGRPPSRAVSTTIAAEIADDVSRHAAMLRERL